MNRFGSDSQSAELYDIHTRIKGPRAPLPITESMLRT
jgi:hypothetical protein